MARANLHASDLPSGWSVATGTHPVVPLGGARTTTLVSCLGRSGAPRSVVTDTESTAYSSGDVTVQSDATAVTPASELGQEVQTMHRGQGLACLTRAITAADGALGPVSHPQSVVVLQPVGNYDARLDVRYSAVASGGHTVTTDLYIVVTGGDELTVAFTGVGTPLSTTTEETIVNDMLQRFPGALPGTSGS